MPSKKIKWEERRDEDGLLGFQFDMDGYWGQIRQVTPSDLTCYRNRAWFVYIKNKQALPLAQGFCNGTATAEKLVAAVLKTYIGESTTVSDEAKKSMAS